MFSTNNAHRRIMGSSRRGGNHADHHDGHQKCNTLPSLRNMNGTVKYYLIIIVLYFLVVSILNLNSCSSIIGGVDAQLSNINWNARIAQSQLLAVANEPSDKNFMPSVSNGYLGTVVDSDNIYVGGVYVGKYVVIEKLIGFHSTRARIPATMKVQLSAANMQQFGVGLDIERAMYLRGFNLSNAHIEQRYYAHRVYRSLLVHQIDVSNSNPFPITININNLDSPVSTDIAFKQVECTHTSNFNTKCQVGQITTLETPDSERVTVAVVTSNFPSSIQVNANTAKTFTFLTSIRTSIDSEDPLDDASIDFIKGITLNQDILYSSHIQEWEKIWRSGIELGGNVELAAKINSTLYYLLSATREDYHWGVSPGGIATDSYNGLIFWDQECFVLPSLAYLHPELARGLIQYRFERLEQAKEHAKKYGYKGAMYPFQTGFSGRTVDLIALFNELEQHITGDISFALQLFWQLTKDTKWLNSIGYPMASEIAKFWSSRVSKNIDGVHYDINKVVGPDEFGIGFPFYSGVDNEVFTNAVAQIALRFGNKAASTLGEPITQEWNYIAGNLTILFDSVNQVHPEYQNFPRGNIYFGEYVKQADVVLLGYPLMYDMAPQIRYNDIRYYDKIMWSEGPAMTYSMHTITYLDLNNFTLAAEAFKKSLLNIHPPFNIISETHDPYKHFLDMGSFNFLTGAGGFIQSVQNGYGGVKMYDNYMLLAPKDVSLLGAKFIKLRGVNYLGGSFDLSYDGSIATISVLTSPTVNAKLTNFKLRSGTTDSTLTVGQSLPFKPPAQLYTTE